MKKALICEVCQKYKRVGSDEEFMREVQKHLKQCHLTLDFNQEAESKRQGGPKQNHKAQLDLFLDARIF